MWVGITISGIKLLIKRLFTPCVEVWQTSNLRPLRTGEEKKRRKIETTGQKYNGLPYSVGWP